MGRLRLPGACLVLATLFGTSSCATTALWNGGGEEVYDHEDESFNLQPRVDGFGDFAWKLLLTPFALAFDVCTSPLQALLYEGDIEPLIDAIRDDD